MNPLIDSIGWTLLHFVWQGALLGAATAAALWLLRRAHPSYRYNVACAALLACVLWPAAELSLRLQGGNMITAQMRFADALLVDVAGVGTGGLIVWLQAQILFIVAFWAVCAALLTVRLAAGLLWLGRLGGPPGSDAVLQAQVTRMAARFGITRAVRLRVAAGLSSPLTAGWWRPVIVVPSSLATGMPPDLLEALLAHELAHVRRLDYAVNLGQNVIEALLFYHPAVWWISGRIRLEREQIADELAASHLGQPRTLALALSELERMQFARSALLVGANGGDLLARIRRLLRPETQSLNWKMALPVIALALACIVVFAKASGPHRLSAEHGPLINFNSCARPDYPASALAAGRTGTVALAFKVSPSGTVIDTALNGSSGDSALDDAARTAIARCSFRPAMHNGQAREGWALIKYVWTLD
jgi:D-alanyl-D-alanine endopeptidase (penicillin-binding protein 7)